MRNIGMSFVRMGQYQDALQAFANVMENVPDHQTGYNLVICAFALGNVEGMRQAFVSLVGIPGFEDDKAEEDLDEDEDEDVVQDDGLRDELKKRHNYISRQVWSEVDPYTCFLSSLS
jgi:intraflagellar transport protein 88